MGTVAVMMRRDLGKVRLLALLASPVLGDGKLYVTSRAIAYEACGWGPYLHFIPPSGILGVKASGSRLWDKYLLVWVGGGVQHGFEFRMRHHAQLASTLGQGP